MIEFKHIMKQYNAGATVLKDLNFKCNTSEKTDIIGRRECGKTPTMQLKNRLISSSQRSLLTDGEDISNIDPVKLRRQIGYVIQSVGLFPHMTIGQNVSVVPKLLKWDQSRIDKQVNELLDLVGLDPSIYKDRFPNELSGGQQQR